MAASSNTKMFPVRQRKELGTHLTKVLKDRCLDIALLAQRSIKQVKDTVHVSYYAERLCALEDPNGEPFLLECVNAMCSKFMTELLFYFSTM